MKAKLRIGGFLELLQKAWRAFDVEKWMYSYTVQAVTWIPIRMQDADPESGGKKCSKLNLTKIIFFVIGNEF